MNYGATPDEWCHFDLVEGLTTDLLPVVCRPGQPIYTHSNLNAYGKVPSRYTVAREVVGFTNWTSYQATDLDIAHWSDDADYGICLQTRRVRALDFDITDEAFANYLRDSLSLLGYDIPYRTRSNSSKFLTLFYLEGDYRKQTILTPYGMVEFLASGQQCVVAGRHPSGVRYEWNWSHPIPTFDAAQWNALQTDLTHLIGGDAVWSNPSQSGIADRDVSITVSIEEDPVAVYLVKHGWVVS